MSNIICASLIPAIHCFIYQNCINCLLLHKCTTFKLFLSTVDLSTVQRPNNPHYHLFTVSASKFKDKYCADQHENIWKEVAIVIMNPPSIITMQHFILTYESLSPNKSNEFPSNLLNWCTEKYFFFSYSAIAIVWFWKQFISDSKKCVSQSAIITFLRQKVTNENCTLPSPNNPPQPSWPKAGLGLVSPKKISVYMLQLIWIIS